MLCPFCGDRRTEVLETVHRTHTTYRECQCLYCKAHAKSKCLGIACTESGQGSVHLGKGGEGVELLPSAGIAKWNVAA